MCINHYTYLFNCLPVDVLMNLLECPITYLCIVLVIVFCRYVLFIRIVLVYIISLEWKF